MNQTQKRLNIIKLAISMTDLETIQLQILKLAPMKNDAKVQEILTLLQAESFAQAQAHITDYIETTPKEIHQRVSDTKTPSVSAEDQAIIDEFQLFVTTEPKTTEDLLEIDINQYPSTHPKITKNKKHVDYDALLNLDPDDVLSDNINLNLSKNTTQKRKSKDAFFEETEEEKLDFTLDNSIPKDTFFEEEAQKEEDDILLVKQTQVLTDSSKGNTIKKRTQEKIIEENNTNRSSSYEAIPHISEKFIAMKKQYPPIQNSDEKFDTVEALLRKISQEGYSETEMEEMQSYIKKRIADEKYTEAAQLILLCAATESKFSKFILARELFKGSVLTKNINEAFTLMNTLAEDDYPEALCDLGQFYENGIATTKDLMKAEGLYKEAVNLGIKRAKKHYTRLKKINRNLLKA